MTDSYFIVLLVSFLYVIYTFFVRLGEKSWLSPASFLNLVWTTTFVLTVIFAHEYFFSPIALIFILSALFIFFAGSFSAGKVITVTVEPDIENSEIVLRSVRILKWFILLGAISGLIALLLLLEQYQFNIFSGFSIDRFIDSSARVSSDRYSGIELPKPIMIFLSLGFAGCLCGGNLFAFSRNKPDRYFSILPVLVVLLFTVVSNARAVFLFSLVLYISSYFSSGLWVNKGKFKIFSLKKILTISVFAVFLLVLFLGTQISRYGLKNVSLDQALAITDHLRVWFFGNISGFSQWFKEADFNQFSFTGGKYTFPGIYDFLGLSSRTFGIFQQYFFINDQKEVSNVFSVFRPLIEDFSLYSIYPIFFFAGVVSIWFYRNVISGKIIFIPLLAMIYSMLSWSFIANIFAYNTIIIAYIIYFIITFHIRFGPDGKKS